MRTRSWLIYLGPVCSIRSVHNIRIERLWVDWTSGVGAKWKSFFQTLEIHHGLDPENPAHLWLLHHLFLPMINHEALEWANSWNSHVITLPDQCNATPHALRFLASYKVGDVALMHMEMCWMDFNHTKIIYKQMTLRSMGLIGTHTTIKEFKHITHITTH